MSRVIPPDHETPPQATPRIRTGERGMMVDFCKAKEMQKPRALELVGYGPLRSSWPRESVASPAWYSAAVERLEDFKGAA